MSHRPGQHHPVRQTYLHVQPFGNGFMAPNVTCMPIIVKKFTSWQKNQNLFKIINYQVLASKLYFLQRSIIYYNERS